MILFALFLTSSPVVAQEELTRDIYSEYADSVVSIREVGEGEILATGFVYDSNYIVTSDHVVRMAEHMEIRDNESDVWREVSVVGRAPESDLAVLRAESLPAGAERLEVSSSIPERGQVVGVIGNPLGMGETTVVGRITEINRSLTTREGVELQNMIQISGSIAPGNSGGPVLTPEGEVVGVISARSLGNEIGYAIPSTTVEKVVPRLIAENQTTMQRIQ